jgi:hypothetical protein
MQIYCIKNEWLVIIDLNFDIRTYGVKSADWGGEEYEDEGGESVEMEGDGE